MCGLPLKSSLEAKANKCSQLCKSNLTRGVGDKGQHFGENVMRGRGGMGLSSVWFKKLLNFYSFCFNPCTCYDVVILLLNSVC